MKTVIIRIVNSEWSVKLTSPHATELYVDGKEGLGTCWPASKTIAISDELGADAARETLRHELTHAVFQETQITRSEQFTEEELCDMVGKWGGVIENLQRELFQMLYLPEVTSYATEEKERQET